MADQFGKMLRQAEREGWATYSPTPMLYIAGALAALGVMLIPAPLYFVVSVIAIFGELVRQIPIGDWIEFVPSALQSYDYLISVWPFIAIGAFIGLLVVWRSRSTRHRLFSVTIVALMVLIVPLVAQGVFALIHAVFAHSELTAPQFRDYIGEVGPFLLLAGAMTLFGLWRIDRRKDSIGAVIVIALLSVLGILATPFVGHFLVATGAVLLYMIKNARVDLFSAFYPNVRAFIYYVTGVWPFILGGTLFGIPLAALRKNHGFYRRHVRSNGYEYVAGHGSVDEDKRPSTTGYKRRFQLPTYPHILLLYVSGPIVMLGMAYYVDPRVYPGLLYNAFAVWLASGIAARFIWEWLQGVFLRLARYFVGQPRRSLRAEYQLKQLIEQDPTLSYFNLWDVRVDVRNRHALVLSNIKGDAALRRLKELGAFIDTVDTVEVRESSGTVNLPPAPVVRSQQGVAG